MVGEGSKKQGGAESSREKTPQSDQLIFSKS